MSDVPRLFPPAPLLQETDGTARCLMCKETMRMRVGEKARQRVRREPLTDERTCGCGQLRIQGAPGWKEQEEMRRKLGA